MPRSRRSFRRSTGTRRYRKIFLISVEGSITEREYFRMHIFENRARTIKLLTDKHANSPLHVLERMKKHLREHPLRASYEAWLVVDKDEWRDDQLRPLHSWAQEKENFGLALSNPKFEFWLLLHFEDGVGIASSQNCTQRLKKYVPDYKKGIDERKFTRERILRAIQRAKQRDNPPCADWPRSLGATTVYRLVEKLT